MSPLSRSLQAPIFSSSSCCHKAITIEKSMVGRIRAEKTRSVKLPVIDLSAERGEVSKLIVRASEEFGFFKVINHGVSEAVVAEMEAESFRFFGMPGPDKQRAGPANPCGYGTKNIGCNGDIGQVEYLLLKANPLSVAQTSTTVSTDPIKFSCAVNGYVEAVREVACEILDLMAEGLWVPDTSVFSRLIRDVDSDSLLRLNHYPPLFFLNNDADTSPSPPSSSSCHRHQQHHSTCNSSSSSSSNRIGFGEHSDPQILTLLRSNDVSGLQISLVTGEWVPVSPDPAAFCVNVGDLLQAMTNGRFVSVRHRAVANSRESRLSMAYFAAPPPHAEITPPPELVTPPHGPCLYAPFTWADYKRAAYSLRLGDSRLNLFRAPPPSNHHNIHIPPPPPSTHQ